MRELATNNRHRKTCLPSPLIFDHGVKYGEQLVHASNKSDFWRLSSFKQAIVELFDHGIKPSSDNGTHIKGTADMGSATPNNTFTFKLATVAVKWGNPDQSGNFLSVECAQLWQLKKEG